MDYEIYFVVACIYVNCKEQPNMITDWVNEFKLNSFDKINFGLNSSVPGVDENTFNLFLMQHTGFTNREDFIISVYYQCCIEQKYGLMPVSFEYTWKTIVDDDCRQIGLLKSLNKFCLKYKEENILYEFLFICWVLYWRDY